MKTKKRHHTGPRIQRLLVDYVVKNFDYFRAHPSHLAWAMMWYDGINATWRQKRDWDSYENPKDYLIDQSGTTLSEKDADILYDAWGVTVANHQVYNDEPEGLGSKRNKTLDEWVAYKTGDSYPHRELYPNKYRVWDQVLNTNGNGMEWNADGFICEDGPSGVDNAIFNGYTRCEKDVDEKIRAGVLRYVEMMAARPDIGKSVYEYVEKAIDNNRRIHSGENYFDVLEPDRKERQAADMFPHLDPAARKKMLDELKKQFSLNKETNKKTRTVSDTIRLYPFSKGYSNLCSMPDNAHESYISAGVEMCEMLLDGRAVVMGGEQGADYDKEQKKLAGEFLKKWKNK